MLTKADDYPIHQTPEPIAYSGTDRNFYDRYFFNGYARDGECFFAVAMGIYPHLNVIDAAFSVIHGGRQHNVRASRCLHMERLDTRAGPISVEVVKPLEALRLRVDDRVSGIKADLAFAARARPIEEPRYTRRIGPRTFFDLTRMTQNGTYEGWIEITGARLEVRPERFLGTRDRSWGVRQIGAQDPQPHAPLVAPQFYWLWAPLNFDDSVFLYDVNQDASGEAWHESAFLGGLGDVEPEAMAAAASHIVFKPGTRHAKSAELRLRRKSGSDVEVELEPAYQFSMAGIGYFHPEWGHGVYTGEDRTGYDVYELASVDETQPLHLHVQAFCRARLRENGRTKDGVGVLEQLILGPHAPSGFRDLLDGAR
ncbi:MAG TPA: hypothetical protein VLF14_09175 [Candidatus Binatia bacterium]|nr:hypothetical protein [Candidatus Binatia bacterium]